MRKLLVLVAPLFLFANESGVDVDIVPRSVNFVIFLGIIYYLLSDRLKDFFTDRTNQIQSKLDEVEKKLKESEKRKEDAIKEVEKAKQLAQELVDSASRDIENIKSKILSKYENEIRYLEKSYEEKIQNEYRKAKIEIVEEIVDRLLSSGIDLNQKDLTDIVMKKVA